MRNSEKATNNLLRIARDLKWLSERLEAADVEEGTDWFENDAHKQVGKEEVVSYVEEVTAPSKLVNHLEMVALHLAEAADLVTKNLAAIEKAVAEKTVSPIPGLLKEMSEKLGDVSHHASQFPHTLSEYAYELKDRIEIFGLD